MTTRHKLRAQLRAAQHERRQVIAALLVIALTAFLVRTVGAWAYTFNNGSGDIWFRGNDAWYHYRLIENMAANWPHSMSFDPFTGYPDGSGVVVAPLLSWLVVGLGKVLTLGAPSDHLLKVLTVLLPPVAGVATMLPVYFIGREVYSRWVGVVATGLVMLLPTQFLSRSILGFTDHHVLETLFSTATILFLILGYKRQQWRWYVLAGVALAAYFLSWHGALFILSVVLLWIFVQYAADMGRGKQSHYRTYGPAITAVVTCAIWFPFHAYNADWRLSVLFFGVLAALAPFLALCSRVTHNKYQWWGMVIGIAIWTGTALFIAMPGFRDTMKVAIQIAFPTHLGVRSIGETKAMSLQYFATVYATNIATAGAALYWTLKERHEFLLVALWGAIMLMFTITQMRWEYYLVVPLALLSAYGFVRVSTYVNRDARRGSSLLTILFILFATCAASLGFAGQGSLMTGDWHEALTWLRNNSPEPYDSAVYYELDSHEVADYGVLAWWDYGHFITQVSKRVPVANPFQQNVDDVSLFLVDGVDVPGVQYVIIDEATVAGKWYAIPRWLGRETQIGMGAPADSPAYQLWTGTYPGWEVVHHNQSVVILARAY
jgi:dolichyl-diphosphooligosaccharide--protein glycosyltransferase